MKKFKFFSACAVYFSFCIIPLYATEQDIEGRIKPIPLINQSTGVFDGICGHNTRFQLFCAGLSALRRTHSCTLGARENSSRMNTTMDFVLEAYSRHNGSAPFNLAPYITFKEWYPLPSGALSYARRKGFNVKKIPLIFNKNSRELRFNLSSASGNDLLVLYIDHEELLKVPVTDLPHKDFLEIRADLSRVRAGHLPYYLSTDTHSYELVGMSKGHRYFNLYRNPIVNLANKYWDIHINSCMRYKRTWWVVDDAAIWKASIRNSGAEDENPESVGRALMNNFPGVSEVFMYSPIENRSNDTQNQESTQLILTRDTPTYSKFKGLSLFALGVGVDVTAAAACTCALGLIIPPVGALMPLMSTITGLASFIYHSRQVAPLFKKRIVYDAQRQEVGPDENV